MQKINSFEMDSTKMETERQSVMMEFEEKQRTLSKQADGFDERTKELAKVLDQVKAGVTSCLLFVKSRQTAVKFCD